MLNKVKKNIVPMLDTLGEALTQYLAQPTQELLSGIISFIGAIDAPVGEESRTVAALSKSLQESLPNPSLQKVEQLYNEYCNAIENLPVQYKVVFLPYYDNTWDSLASVYEAFAADPMFVTEIVIIPIRRNTPTGWKTLYEDYLTPKGIPHTPFPHYSFETDLPDFVFYNNPYDGVNIEKFQSQNIKPYAGCMVYVPYFLYQHMRQDKVGLERETEQYTQLSGHDSADLFVAQGKSFLKTFAHRSRNGRKMVAIGNPKTDYIHRHKHDYPRYPEWDEIVKGKTVFLLNTHYHFALESKYRVFLPDLLEFIEQNEDLALIWRPHPQSFFMLDEDDASENRLEWQSLLDRVNANARMILDRTENDLSAIMYSDAVLSHASSVVAEAIAADKPVFLFWRRPSEIVTAEVWLEMDVDYYIELLKRVRKDDAKKLFLASAVHYRGFTRDPTDKAEITNRYLIKVPMLEFMDDIRNGIDSKKDLRAAFREQLFINNDGTCGQKIHDYIVRLIEA